MMSPDGRVFLKSEWGPIGDDWPCVSFTKRSVGSRLSKDFVPGRDVLVYVGTINTDLTRNPEHRSRLISAVVVEPNQILETRKIVPPESWARSVEANGDRWPYSLAVLSAATVDGPPYPRAHDVIPEAYRSFAAFQNRGNVIEALGVEREAVMRLSVTALHLKLSPEVRAYIELRASVDVQIPKDVAAEVLRMANLIIQRVRKGGEVGVIVNPIRSAPNLSDLHPLLTRKWMNVQRGLCALCGGALVASTTNRMLQASPDRVDSTNGAYDDANLQVTHLACNLAKNEYGIAQFEEWLAVLRGVDLASEP